MDALGGWYDAAIRLCNLFFSVRKFLQLAVGLSDIPELIILACGNLIWVNRHDIFTLLQIVAWNPCAVAVVQFRTEFAMCSL
jgi:hypothetical protein